MRSMLEPSLTTSFNGPIMSNRTISEFDFTSERGVTGSMSKKDEPCYMGNEMGEMTMERGQNSMNDRHQREIKDCDSQLDKILTIHVKEEDAENMKFLLGTNISCRSLQHLVKWRKNILTEAEFTLIAQQIQQILTRRNGLHPTNQQKLLKVLGQHNEKVKWVTTIKGVLSTSETMSTMERKSLVSLLTDKSIVAIYAGQGLSKQVERCLKVILTVNNQPINADFIEATMKTFESPVDVSQNMKICLDRIELMRNQLPCFQLYKKYEGKDLEYQHNLFTLELLKLLLTIGCPMDVKLQIFDEMITKKNYMFNIAELEDLSKKDKDIFVEALYTKENLRQLELINKTPQKIGALTDLEFSTLKKKLLSAKIPVKKQNELTLYQLFKECNFEYLVREIKGDAKKVIEILEKDCSNFVKCVTKKFCQASEKINIIFKLREKLYQTGINYELWAHIQSKIIVEQDEYAIDCIKGIDLVKREELNKWIEKELVPYIDASQAHNSMVEKAKWDINSALMRTDAGFNSTEGFRKELLEKPCEETITATKYLTQSQREQVKVILKEMPSYIVYQNDDKFDIERRRIQIKRIIFKAFRKSMSKLLQDVSFDTLESVAKYLLDIPEAKKIRSHASLSASMSQSIIENLQSNKQFQKFASELDRNKLAKKAKAHLERVPSNNVQARRFKASLELYGTKQRIDEPHKMESQTVQSARCFMKKKPDVVNSIPTEDEIALSFKSIYPLWIQIKYQNARQEFTKVIAKATQEDPKEVEETFIKALEQAKMDLNAVLAMPTYSTINSLFKGAERMQSMSQYRDLFEIFRALQVNKAFIADIQLESFVEEYIDEVDFKPNQQKRQQLLNGLKAAIKGDINQVYKMSMISHDIQNQIKELIVNNPKYAACSQKKKPPTTQLGLLTTHQKLLLTPQKSIQAVQRVEILPQNKPVATAEMPSNLQRAVILGTTIQSSKAIVESNIDGVPQELIDKLVFSSNKIFEANSKHMFLSELKKDAGDNFQTRLKTIFIGTILRQDGIPNNIPSFITERSIRKKRFVTFMDEKEIKDLLVAFNQVICPELRS